MKNRNVAVKTSIVLDTETDSLMKKLAIQEQRSQSNVVRLAIKQFAQERLKDENDP